VNDGELEADHAAARHLSERLADLPEHSAEVLLRRRSPAAPAGRSAVQSALASPKRAALSASDRSPMLLESPADAEADAGDAGADADAGRGLSARRKLPMMNTLSAIIAR